METLRSVFPMIPEPALARVLEICDENVEAASDWILENNWSDLVDEEATAATIQVQANNGEGGDEDTTNEERQVPAGNAVATTTVVAVASTVNEVAAAAAAPVVAADRAHSASDHRSLVSHANFGFDVEHDGESEEGEDEEDEEEEDEEDDEEDEDDGDGHYYDSGDEGAFIHRAIPPLAKRIKVTASADSPSQAKQEHFWVAFDDQVVQKSLIELLNTNLSKLAHEKVALLSKSTKLVSEEEATSKLRSVLDCQHAVMTDSSSRNDSAGSTTDSPAPVPGQKRKRSEDAGTPCRRTHGGYFAHFFSISDLDMVWRSVLHAHLFNRRFGELIEFHTATSGVFNKRDFDELMHIHSNLSSGRAAAHVSSSTAMHSLKCCLILPCDHREDEIFRVGKHLHSLLKLPGSLYYRTIDCGKSVDENGHNNGQSRCDGAKEDAKLTEESFRQYARYRVKKEEVSIPKFWMRRNDSSILTTHPSFIVLQTEEDTSGEPKADKYSVGTDHFLAYQQQRKVEYCLHVLQMDTRKWNRRVSDQ
ncbi:TPA: hypothetical protein N0F65_010724 [Lagenidium giganteum]|uniref:CUE domain-containing protein n=1 Tax=Lagenidium giganteum TaxID=4803 RepID=A0AAV2YJ75_9STRA|nr:TPA: hypothetical protein N0F65_010724 [Lagenidium giganteum]